MSTFTLAISCLTTSNLLWFVDLTFQVPMQYCSLQHQTLLLSPVTPTTGYCFCFGSIPSFSGVISPLISSSLLFTYQPGEFIIQCPMFLPFHTVHGVLKALILKWFAILISSGLHFVVSPPRPIHLGWSYTSWLSFIELDKAVAHVITLASFLWIWFQSVCPLMPSSVPTILLGFLLPWTWVISSRLLQQSAAAATYFGRGVSPLSCSPVQHCAAAASCSRAHSTLFIYLFLFRG